MLEVISHNRQQLTLLLVLFCCICLSQNAVATGQDLSVIQENGVDANYQHAPVAAVERWQDWKFGMRIHWGVYSVLGLDASTPLVGSSSEFHTIWSTLYQVFNPTDFDANAWANLAKRAGMKYFVFTTRHADGFSMFDTATRVQSIRRDPGQGPENHAASGIGPTERCYIQYSIMDTPYKRDVVAAVVKAFRKEGLGIGLYYNWADFHDPDFRWDKRNEFYDPTYSKASNPHDWHEFIHREGEQVHEICTKYGKLDDIEFDQGTPAEAWPDIVRIVKAVRISQPTAVLRNRGIGAYGDFSSPEHWVPNSPSDRRLAGKPWEAIEQLGSRWAYQPDDAYKSKEWLLSTLIDVVAKGGNFMPGVSPMANGEFPQETIDRLEYVGDWLKVNGEAIYNTRPWSVYQEGNDIRFTRSKDGNYVYVISLKWPGEQLTLHSVQARSGSRITMLGLNHSLQWRQNSSGLTIQMPSLRAADRPSRQAYVFKIECQPFRRQ